MRPNPQQAKQPSIVRFIDKPLIDSLLGREGPTGEAGRNPGKSGQALSNPYIPGNRYSRWFFALFLPNSFAPVEFLEEARISTSRSFLSSALSPGSFLARAVTCGAPVSG
jgi:hypothetical protein